MESKEYLNSELITLFTAPIPDTITIASLPPRGDGTIEEYNTLAFAKNCNFIWSESLSYPPSMTTFIKERMLNAHELTEKEKEDTQLIEQKNNELVEKFKSFLNQPRPHLILARLDAFFGRKQQGVPFGVFLHPKSEPIKAGEIIAYQSGVIARDNITELIHFNTGAYRNIASFLQSLPNKKWLNNVILPPQYADAKIQTANLLPTTLFFNGFPVIVYIAACDIQPSEQLGFFNENYWSAMEIEQQQVPPLFTVEGKPIFSYQMIHLCLKLENAQLYDPSLTTEAYANKFIYPTLYFTLNFKSLIQFAKLSNINFKLNNPLKVNSILHIKHENLCRVFAQRIHDIKESKNILYPQDLLYVLDLIRQIKEKFLTPSVIDTSMSVDYLKSEITLLQLKVVELKLKLLAQTFSNEIDASLDNKYYELMDSFFKKLNKQLNSSSFTREPAQPETELSKKKSSASNKEFSTLKRK